jgi:hypothetical protein
MKKNISYRIITKEYFLKILILGKDITIDESMVLFREKKNALRFCISHKRTKLGFEIHSIVDTQSNFLYDNILVPWK